MKTIVHKNDSRGSADHGWLKTKHTFSFSNYYNPDRIHFGALRVLNDDIIYPGMGFGLHPHDNMEIITIILDGELEHKDSMGNGSVIGNHEVQVMSAGSGIMHSEFNPSSKKKVNLLQIWVFPNKKNVKPRYDQAFFSPEKKAGEWLNIVSPDGKNDSMWIHQDAWFSLGNFNGGSIGNYELKKKNNGLYLFVISGEIELESDALSSRDGIGIIEPADKTEIKILSDAELLAMEIPMVL